MKNMSRLAIACISLGVSLPLDNAAFAQDQITTFSKKSPVTKNALVELFTSDGCDSCPPANKWLSSIVQNGDPSIIPVSMHVTYWNNLGWTDPASHPYFDQKQERYTQLGLARFSYTPAIFLSGSEWSGWRTNAWQNISAINKQPAKIDIAVDAVIVNATKVQVTLQLTAVKPVESSDLFRARQLVYLYEDAVIDKPRAGELNGITLRHDHVIRKWDERPVQGWPNKTSIEFDLPAATNKTKLGLVAFVQSQDGREIFQVIDLPLRDGL